MKLGLIGAGFISKFQTIALSQVRGWEIAGICSPEGADALAAFVRSKSLGSPVVYPSVTELVKNVDVVGIFSPNFTRVAVMEELAAAVGAGHPLKGVICEKPLGRNLPEARRLVDLAADLELPTAYYENQLFMKPLRAQLEQLAPVQRTMGPFSLVRSSEEHGGPHSDWFWDPVRQGGGVLNDMGCHSIAVGWFTLTPHGKGLTFLRPESVSAEIALLKWGLPTWREKLLKERGIDYTKAPAEDFATGLITYRNPETGQLVKAQFTNSWMFEKQGLRIFTDGMGPGYAFEINTLVSPLTVFVGDRAAEAIADQESALEKATASRGLLAVQHNEADLYGYTDENEDALAAFAAGRDGMLPWSYGLEVLRLVMAAYMAAERRRTIDLTDPAVQRELEGYVPAVARGEGADLLY
jgi:predicted dehydrogenase